MSTTVLDSPWTRELVILPLALRLRSVALHLPKPWLRSREYIRFVIPLFLFWLPLQRLTQLILVSACLRYRDRRRTQFTPSSPTFAFAHPLFELQLSSSHRHGEWWHSVPRRLGDFAGSHGSPQRLPQPPAGKTECRTHPPARPYCNTCRVFRPPQYKIVGQTDKPEFTEN